jgi:hypothetical protein
MREALARIELRADALMISQDVLFNPKCLGRATNTKMEKKFGKHFKNPILDGR